MKTANAALVIAAAILLLWLVTSGRTKNLSAAWAALMGSTGFVPGGSGVAGGGASGSWAPTTGAPMTSPVGAGGVSFNLPAFPSGINTSLPGLGFGTDLPTLAMLGGNTPA